MRFLATSCVWTIALAWMGSSAYGDTFEITSVEEDWELVVTEPSPTQDSPQISTWMSPTGDLAGEHFAADFNHAQRPDFTSGGFQVKAFDGETMMADKISDSGDNFIYDHETITWTQRMEIRNGGLEYAIADGHSQSWGTFGNNGFRVRFEASPVSNLNNYSVNKSAEWAGVGFGGNRVQSLVLKRVRYYVNGQYFATVDVDLRVQ